MTAAPTGASLAGASDVGDWLGQHLLLVLCVLAVFASVDAILWQAARVLSVQPKEVVTILDDTTPQTARALETAFGAGILAPDFYSEASFADARQVFYAVLKPGQEIPKYRCRLLDGGHVGSRTRSGRGIPRPVAHVTGMLTLANRSALTATAPTVPRVDLAYLYRYSLHYVAITRWQELVRGAEPHQQWCSSTPVAQPSDGATRTRKRSPQKPASGPFSWAKPRAATRRRAAAKSGTIQGQPRSTDTLNEPGVLLAAPNGVRGLSRLAKH